ncbi:hypothetical protein GCM10017673_11710 [Streptosporangium violaceochromogenes]|nr:hypothetical protein GCM10017673_11710 [Streptosporangium violaceochromogenes]
MYARRMAEDVRGRWSRLPERITPEEMVEMVPDGQALNTEFVDDLSHRAWLRGIEG